MNYESFIKYVIWIVFFGLVLTALYFMLRKAGVWG